MTESFKRPASATAGPAGQLATSLALSSKVFLIAYASAPSFFCLMASAVLWWGAQLLWSRIAVDSVTALEGPGECSLIGWGRTASAPVAALLNGTFIQGFELDDFHPYAPLHSASLVLPSLLATAEKMGGVIGEQLLGGAIAGCEISPRVGLALHGGQLLSRDWHSGSVFGTHAIAASGVLLGLDAAGFEDASGLAGTQSAGLMAAQYEAMSRRMHHGFAARNGVYAAHLAASGYTGIQRVFERE